jgi:hypothetical protein
MSKITAEAIMNSKLTRIKREIGDRTDCDINTIESRRFQREEVKRSDTRPVSKHNVQRSNMPTLDIQKQILSTDGGPETMHLETNYLETNYLKITA